jgi:hypothetical protein
LTRTRQGRRATLLVVDDADRAGLELRSRLAGLVSGSGELHALVLVTGCDAAALEPLGADAALTLSPLGPAAVRRIALAYRPVGTSADVPVEALIEASGGIAGRVHEEAGDWARREAERRVDAVAARAASERSQARAREAELAESVVDLRSTLARSAPTRADGHGRVICPYKGLAGFDVADSAYFFGREQLVAELVARLVGAPLLGVVGASGAGKSSVVKAGLLAALADGVLPGSDRWGVAFLRPGSAPAEALDRAVATVAGAPRAVLVVDQFEEAFTAGADEREREEFAARVVAAAGARDDNVAVVIAVRADFYGR